MALFVPVLTEILNKLFIFSDSVVTSSVLSLDGTLSRVVASLLLQCYQFQYWKAIQSRYSPQIHIGVVFTTNKENAKKSSPFPNVSPETSSTVTGPGW